MTTFAYIRVSLDSLTTDNQRVKIIDAGFNVDEFVSEDGVSGTVKAMDRPEFSRMMSIAKKGDTCICTMVDRLGRNARDILYTVEEFQRLGIKLRVLQFDGVDVTSSMGKMILTVMAACAELERNLISERTVTGMKRAGDAGVKLGAPLKITPATLEAVIKDKECGMTLDQLSAKYSVHRNTLQKNISKWIGKMTEYAEEFKSREIQYSLKATVAQ